MVFDTRLAQSVAGSAGFRSGSRNSVRAGEFSCAFSSRLERLLAVGEGWGGAPTRWGGGRRKEEGERKRERGREVRTCGEGKKKKRKGRSDSTGLIWSGSIQPIRFRI